MRRATVIGLAMVLVLLAAVDAGAHPLPTVSQLPAGRPVTVTIAVPAEVTAAMTGVDVTIPSGFVLDAPIRDPSWQETVRAGAVQYRGGNIPAGGVALFSFRGEAPKPAALRFPMTVHSADGSIQAWDGVPGRDGRPAPTVYFGVKPPTGASSSRPWTMWLGVALIGAAVVAATVRMFRRRRSGSID